MQWRQKKRGDGVETCGMCHVSCHLSLFTRFTAVFICKALKYTFFRKRLTCYTSMTLKEKFDSSIHASWWGNPNNNNLEQKFSASSSNFPSAKSRYLIGCKVAATFDKGRFLRPLYGPICQGSRLLWVTQSYSHFSHVDGQTKWTVKMRSVELYWATIPT